MESPDLLEEDPLVRKIIYYTEKPLWLHGYISIFIPLYAIWAFLWMDDSILPSFELAMIALAGIGILQTLTVLSCVWSVNARCLLTCTTVCHRVERFISSEKKEHWKILSCISSALID